MPTDEAIHQDDAPRKLTAERKYELGLGLTINEVSKIFGCTWHTARRHLATVEPSGKRGQWDVWSPERVRRAFGGE